MAPKKKVSGFIKLQIVAGQANPAPPVRHITQQLNNTVDK
jgi:ribosomal protein L11